MEDKFNVAIDEIENKFCGLENTQELTYTMKNILPISDECINTLNVIKGWINIPICSVSTFIKRYNDKKPRNIKDCS